MAFEIVNRTYHTFPDENPKKYGYIEGYTSNTIGHTYLRLNICSIPDQKMYDCYKKTDCLDLFELKPEKIYGEGVRLDRKQVVKLIFELTKWLITGK